MPWRSLCSWCACKLDPRLSQICALTVKTFQNYYRQTCLLRAMSSSYRDRNMLPEACISFTETDLWECWQDISPFNWIELPFQIQTSESGSKQLNSAIMSATTVPRLCGGATWIYPSGPNPLRSGPDSDLTWTQFGPEVPWLRSNSGQRWVQIGSAVQSKATIIIRGCVNREVQTVN